MAERIKALCITEDPDRPTTATFAGLQRAGVDVTVICPPGERRAWLEENGVRTLDVPLRRQFDREAKALLAWLAPRLAVNGLGHHRIDWLVPE